MLWSTDKLNFNGLKRHVTSGTMTVLNKCGMKDKQKRTRKKMSDICD